MGSSRFRDYARNDYGVELTEAEARSFRERFFAAYPNLRRWPSEVGRSTARETRTLSGRRRFLPATDFTARVNTPVQGTCADGLKQALSLLWERRAEHPEAVPVLAVHDQIVIETTPEAAEGVREWLVKAMKDGMQEFTDPVPVKVDTKIVTSETKEEE
jgi:DNA polymerase-1